MPGGRPVINEEMSALESARASDVISLENIGDSWRNLDNEASNTTSSSVLAHPESKPPPQPAASVIPISGSVPQEKSNHTITTSEGDDGDFDFKSNGVRSRWIGSRKFAALVVLVLIIGAVMLGTYTFSTRSAGNHHTSSATTQIARRKGGTASQAQHPGSPSTTSTTRQHPPNQHSQSQAATAARHTAPSASQPQPATGAAPAAAAGGDRAAGASAAAAASSAAAAQAAAAKAAKAAQLQRLAQAQQQASRSGYRQRGREGGRDSE
jgi:hypothetical protein